MFSSCHPRLHTTHVIVRDRERSLQCVLTDCGDETKTEQGGVPALTSRSPAPAVVTQAGRSVRSGCRSSCSYRRRLGNDRPQVAYTPDR